MSRPAIATVSIIALCSWQTAHAQLKSGTHTAPPCGHTITPRQYSEKEVQMNAATSATGKSQTEARTRATAKISVQSSKANPYDHAAGPQLLELRLTETFTGDIEAESPVRALQVLRDDKSACLVSLQRVSGKLDGREGTFVLQGSETVENGRIEATWIVVPGSGTGDLAGLRGEGGFEGQFGQGSVGTLEYWFD